MAIMVRKTSRPGSRATIRNGKTAPISEGYDSRDVEELLELLEVITSSREGDSPLPDKKLRVIRKQDMVLDRECVGAMVRLRNGYVALVTDWDYSNNEYPILLGRIRYSTDGRSSLGRDFDIVEVLDNE